MILTAISEVGTIIDELKKAMENSNSERPESSEATEASDQDERESANDAIQDEVRALNSGKPFVAPEPSTALTFDGTTVHSLDELRQSCTKEALLGYFHDGSLEEWLQEHYYEKQADDVGMIVQDDRKAFSKLCKALGIDSLDGSVEPKKEAHNQEELATLLRDGEDEIYLFGNKFSIPIRKPGITYICADDVTLENAYTQEQYCRAGISVSGIMLPDNVSEEMADAAKQAAAANGYDDYADHHSQLAGEIYKNIKSEKLYRFYSLNYNLSKASDFFKSKYECEKYREKYIREAYNNAQEYLQVGSAVCIAQEAASYYSELLTDFFKPLDSKLKELCAQQKQDELWANIEEIVSFSSDALLASFEEELSANSDYYSMYKFDYFLESAGIEEHDYRTSEEGFFRVIETLFADNIEYTIDDPYKPINELEKDLNEHAATFFRAAQGIYVDYIKKLLDMIDVIGKNLPSTASLSDSERAN